MSDAALVADAIRIVLAGVPRLTAELVRQSALVHGDIVIIEECRRPDDITGLIETREIDVIVTTRTSRGVPHACQEALFGARSVPVIAVVTEGGLEVYERRAHQEAAMDDLFDEIRRVAHRPRPTS